MKFRGRDLEKGRRPDRLERSIRFGCGFLFFAFLGFFYLLRRIPEPDGLHWAVLAGVALAAGVLAMRFGDVFWLVVSKFARRWW